MASCIQIEALLQSWVDNETTVSERLLVEEHIKTCAACKVRMDMTRTTAALVFETLSNDQLCGDLTGRVMAHLPEMAGAASVSDSLRRQVAVEGERTRQWIGMMARVMPVAAPAILLILAGLIWLAWPSFNTDTDNVAGMITYCDTDATHHAQGGQRPARVRSDIIAGDRFETGSGRLMLGLHGPSHITVFENAVVQVRAPREIFLERGTIFLDVFHDARRFQVHTPDGRITVLGTAFQVNINRSGTEVTVVNGEVMVENENSFVRLHRNTQATFEPAAPPSVRHGVDTAPYVRTAREVRPDPVAERHFLVRVTRDNARQQARAPEQLFMVDTKRRPISTIMLSWTPDPYTSGHRGYSVYVSDSAMAPLFKATIAAELFQDKTKNMVHLAVPPSVRNHNPDLLHITVMPESGAGLVETTFTEVAAIGDAS